MTAQAFPTLQITNGTSTLTLIDGAGGATSYTPIQEWEPQVATRRLGGLGGRAPFTDVDEEIPVNVSGSTAATVLDNINNAWELLDEAGRWFTNEDGDVATPVVLKYWPQGSTLTAALQAVIIRKLDESPDLKLPPTFSNDSGIIKLVRGMRMRFRRRGLWLLPDAFSNSSSSTTNANLITVTLSETLTTPSPVKLSFSGFPGTGGSAVASPGGYVFVAPGDRGWLRVLNASSAGASGAGLFTIPNDAASNARGTTILRYTPTGTTAQTSAGFSIASSPTNTLGRRLAIFAMVRNNDATKTYQIQANLTHLGESYSTPITLIDGSSTAPHPHYFGEVVFRKPAVNTISTTITFTITASASGSTVDLDTVVVICLDDPDACHVIAIDATSITAVGSASLVIDHATLTDPSPVVSYYDGGSSVYPSYRGNAYVMARGSTINALLLMQTGTKWRIVDASPAVTSNTLTATVSKGYLSPQ